MSNLEIGMKENMFTINWELFDKSTPDHRIIMLAYLLKLMDISVNGEKYQQLSDVGKSYFVKQS